MIRFESLTIGYGDRTLVSDACAEIPDGSFTALLGRNGSGKSTLLSAVCGAKKDYSGNIYVDSVDVKFVPQYRLAMHVSFVSTARVRIPGMTCTELVSLGRAPYTGWTGRLGDKDREIVRHSLETVGMEDFASRTMEKMSDGECQRVMIARALAQDAEILILDEPTASLDYPNQLLVIETISLLKTKGYSILFSTHSPEQALMVSDSLILLEKGKKAEEKSPEELLDGSALSKLYGKNLIIRELDTGKSRRIICTPE